MAGDKQPGDKPDTTMPDPSSPYYLHPSDYPRQMHVNDALSDHNYTDWMQEMVNFLFAKKNGFVDGTIKKPKKTDFMYTAWMRCDAMIKGWLTTAMEKDIRDSVRYANTTADIWRDLVERFGKESAPRAYELKRTLASTRKDGASISAYFTKMRRIWDEIQAVLPAPYCTCHGCTCNVGKRLTDLKDKRKLYEFLMGLDPEFSVIRTQILAQKSTPTLNTTYHLVLDDEKQRAITFAKKPNSENAAYQAYVPSKREGTSKLNKEASTEVKKESGDRIEHYDFCGRDGHKKERCFKRVGYPEWWPGNKTKRKTKAACVEGDASPISGLNGEKYQQFLHHFGGKTNSLEDKAPRTANMAGRVNEGKTWVLDSGARAYNPHK
ncbi:uncharacterized protein LOC143573263 [Bidens hawaiensis]|uniref:uncharacterized protein LOC143573263 n=1 Tax=Bidens hawaiensis TaxID=980011 RepID=UPI00404ABC4E